jgi:hypothetical protein
MKNQSIPASVREEVANMKKQAITAKETSTAVYWVVFLSIAGVIAAVAVITNNIY